MLALLLAMAPAAADPLGVADAFPRNCTSKDPKEVVVCGSREKSRRYRLPKLSNEYERRAIRAEGMIAGIPTRLHVETVELPGGQKSNRVMLTVSTSF